MPYSRSLLAGSALVLLGPVLAARTPTETSSPVVTITAEELERLPSGRNISDILRALPCSPQTVPTFTRPQSAAPNAPGSLSCIGPADIRMVEIYRIHNLTRARFGSQPLVWDPALAAAAQTYAGHLARTGRLVHAPREGRGNSRENLSMGMLGWDSRQMLGNWLNEQRLFRPGTYPNVSTTGRWDDVSHFTQMVWPKTVRLGCGMTDGSGHRWLVCRYAPGGNKDGVWIGPGNQPPGRPSAQPLCTGPQGPMMCPGPGDGAANQGDGENEAGGAANQDDGGNNPGGTRERPREEPVAANPEEGFRHREGECEVGVIVKIHLVEVEDPRNPNKVRKEKAPYNLAHGFSEIVVPYGWDARPIVKPDADATGPYTGKMRAIWGIADGADLKLYRVSGSKAKLRRGRWDSKPGVDEITPPQRPTSQTHRLWREWDPDPETDPPKCEKKDRFTVTFAGEINIRNTLDTKAFVEQAGNAGHTGTRPRTRFHSQTRAFHEARPQPFIRDDKVVVPIGIYWDLPESCCDIRNAERKVIQFARAAIHGPNGRQGKGWALDIHPDEHKRATDRTPGDHNPTYTSNPGGDGERNLEPGSGGGTRPSPSDGNDVEQWDAPGMPKDLFDRLHAAQGASIYRQQFLSLLVCKPPTRGRTGVTDFLGGGRICQVAVTTVRWDFPGQAGINNAANYRPPRISVSFDVRDANCADLRAFLAANGLLEAFERPSKDARNLETLAEQPYQELDRSVTDWETNPFAGVRFP